VSKVDVFVWLNQHMRLSIRDVMRVTGVSRSKLYQLVKHRKFPALIKSGRSSRWVSAEVATHMAQEEAAR
jgi:predicted DNA-binding transcriptional regulator AlpA